MAKESTKQELIEEIARLQQLCADNKIKFQQEPPSLMNNIRQAENDALQKIIDVIDACEDLTGREHPLIELVDDGGVRITAGTEPKAADGVLEAIVNINFSDVDEKAVAKVRNQTSLRNMLSVTSKYAVTNCSFKDANDFKNWVSVNVGQYYDYHKKQSTL